MLRHALSLLTAAALTVGALLMPAAAVARAPGTPCAAAPQHAPGIREVSGRGHATVLLVTARDAASCPQDTGSTDSSTARYRLRITVLDRSGRVASTADDAAVIDLSSGDIYGVTLTGGVGSIRLSAGHYAVGSEYSIKAADGTISAAVVTYQPNVRLDADHRVTLDGRGTHPVRVSLDNHTARQIQASAFLLQRTAHGEVQAMWPVKSPDTSKVPIYLPALPHASAVTAEVHTTWTKHGATEDSPYLYEINSTSHGIPADPSWHVHAHGLARVREHYNAEGVTGHAWVNEAPELPEDMHGIAALYVITTKVELPSVRTEYYTPRTWNGDEALGSDRVEEADNVFSTQTYQRGGRYTRQWNRPPLTAQFSLPPVRYDDDVEIDSSLFTDTSGDVYLNDHFQGTAGTTELRDDTGTLIAHNDAPGSIFATLPRTDRRYTLRSHAERAASYSTFDTNQDVTWTFFSGHDSGNGTTLPLPLINYRVPVDDMGAAHRGPLELDAWITTLPGTPPPAANSLTLEVSYDDGATWTKIATTAGSDGHRTTRLTPPTSAHFVSLRASGRDTAGNTITETLVRAFAVNP